MLQYPVSRYVRGVEYNTMSDLLADFRKAIEKDAGAPVEKIEVNAAMLIRDLMVFLGMKEPLFEKVLGKGGAQFMKLIKDEPIKLPVTH